MVYIKICVILCHRSTTWWCSQPTGPMWRMPAGCRSMRTSSRRRSRSFTTSTPLAPRSVSTPTHKDQQEAWPCHSSLSHSLSLPSVSLFVSQPSPPEPEGRMAPRVLATADVTGASYDNVAWGGMTHKPPQSQTAFQMKKPLYLSHGWCYDYHRGSHIIINTSSLVLKVVWV